jgi:hypothetical protein
VAKYDALSNYLAKVFSKELTSKVSLTFRQVEQILESALPASAHARKAWWSNNPSHKQAGCWLDIGWEVSKIDLNEQVITFKRNKGFLIGKVIEDKNTTTLEALVDNKGFTLKLSGTDAYAPSPHYTWRQVVQILIDIDPHQFGYLTGQPLHYVFPEMCAELGYSVVNWETNKRWRPRTMYRYDIFCSSCDRALYEGERYTLVWASRKTKRESAPKDESFEPYEISDLLQICSNCANVARAELIPLASAPRAISELTKEGFYWFARHQGGNSSSKRWKYSVSEDKCSVCNKKLEIGQEYSLIEVGEHKITNEGIETLPETAVTLAVMCDACAASQNMGFDWLGK